MTKIHRVEKTKNFTIIHTQHSFDKQLSFKAKGILTLMLSLPEDWNYSLAGLAQMSGDGVGAIRPGIKELESQGYLITGRARKERGKLAESHYEVFEVPHTNNIWKQDNAEGQSKVMPTVTMPTASTPHMIEVPIGKVPASGIQLGNLPILRGAPPVKQPANAGQVITPPEPSHKTSATPPEPPISKNRTQVNEGQEVENRNQEPISINETQVTEVQEAKAIPESPICNNRIQAETQETSVLTPICKNRTQVIDEPESLTHEPISENETQVTEAQKAKAAPETPICNNRTQVETQETSVLAPICKNRTQVTEEPEVENRILEPISNNKTQADSPICNNRIQVETQETSMLPPICSFPTLENPMLENRPLLSTKESSTKESRTKEKKNPHSPDGEHIKKYPHGHSDAQTKKTMPTNSAISHADTGTQTDGCKKPLSTVPEGNSMMERIQRMRQKSAERAKDPQFADLYNHPPETDPFDSPWHRATPEEKIVMQKYYVRNGGKIMDLDAYRASVKAEVENKGQVESSTGLPTQEPSSGRNALSALLEGQAKMIAEKANKTGKNESTAGLQGQNSWQQEPTAAERLNALINGYSANIDMYNARNTANANKAVEIIADDAESVESKCTLEMSAPGLNPVQTEPALIVNTQQAANQEQDSNSADVTLANSALEEKVSELLAKLNKTDEPESRIKDTDSVTEQSNINPSCENRNTTNQNLFMASMTQPSLGSGFDANLSEASENAAKSPELNKPMPDKVEKHDMVNKKAAGKVDRQTHFDELERTFAQFWDVYPRKVDKKDARKAWDKTWAGKTPDPDKLNAVMNGVHAARNYWEWDGVEKKFIPHASTWLSNERWENLDEYSTKSTPKKNHSSGSSKGGNPFFDNLRKDGHMEWDKRESPTPTSPDMPRGDVVDVIPRTIIGAGNR